MGRKPSPLRQLGFTRQEMEPFTEMRRLGVTDDELEAAIQQAKTEANAAGRHLTESRVFRILGVGRERRRQNVGSADDIPEHLLAWAADLSPEERRMIALALKLTKPVAKGKL